MKTDKFGQLIYSESDLCDQLLIDINGLDNKKILVDNTVDMAKFVSADLNFVELEPHGELDISVDEFDRIKQSNWYMPQAYSDLDIAKYILSLCETQEQLQRCAEELLLFQEKNLFDLLKYLKYLVDTMKENHIIWGIGRGSSVASYVLYLLGVHRINSLYYDLDIREFLK
jgi:DNA polymerase III alpha subunit